MGNKEGDRCTFVGNGFFINIRLLLRTIGRENKSCSLEGIENFH